jgi:CRISPR-associated protein Cas1
MKGGVSMATLYLTEQGSVLRKADERLIVTRGDELIDDIPLIKLERVVVMGKGIKITTPALFCLAKRGIDLVFLTQRGGFVTRMGGGTSKFGRLRYAQAMTVGDDEKVLAIAKQVVKGKLTNQRTLIKRHAGSKSWGRKAIDGIDRMLARLEGARDINVVRGLEGQGASLYFSAFRRLLKQDMGFKKRVYYPPTDPVNALLSFGYTLLLNELVGAVQLVGLDPYLGFFHAIDYGRPSLALDIEEEFRPIIIDSVVLYVVNKRVLTPSDFTKPQGRKKAVYLSEHGRHAFIKAYEHRVNTKVTYPLTGERNTYRRCFELQVRQLARFILGEEREYRPMTMK